MLWSLDQGGGRIQHQHKVCDFIYPFTFLFIWAIEDIVFSSFNFDLSGILVKMRSCAIFRRGLYSVKKPHDFVV